jgi:hypothetical protein
VQANQVVVGPEFRLGHVGPLAVSVWNGRATGAQVDRALALIRELVEQNPTGVMLLAVLAKGCGIPDEEARSKLTAGLTRVRTHVRAVANVVEGQGFGGAALRGALTSIGLVIRPPYPQKVTASVSEAAAFLQQHADGRLRAMDIVDGVAAIRSEA